MSSEINLIEIARAQIRTFSGYGKKTVIRDVATFVGLPVAAGVLGAVFGPPVYSVGSLLTGASVFSGLLVALLVNVFNFSVKIRRDEKIRPEQKLSVTVDELMANAAWTVITGLMFVVLIAIAAAIQTPTSPAQPLAPVGRNHCWTRGTFGYECIDGAQPDLDSTRGHQGFTSKALEGASLPSYESVRRKRLPETACPASDSQFCFGSICLKHEWRPFGDRRWRASGNFR